MNSRLYKNICLLYFVFALVACNSQSDSKDMENEEGESAGVENTSNENTGGESTAGASTVGDSEVAGQNDSGNYVPATDINTTDDLVRTVTLIENVINHAVRQYCDRCPTTANVCDQIGSYTDYSIDDRVATCLFLDAESSGLSTLQERIQCEVMMANQLVDCLQMQSSCNQDEFQTCVQDINFKSCIESEELSRLDNQCFMNPESYTCNDGVIISRELLCDGNDDCVNGEDERADCPPPYTCDDGSSIPASWVCDGTADCAAGDDETVDSCQ